MRSIPTCRASACWRPCAQVRTFCMAYLAEKRGRSMLLHLCNCLNVKARVEDIGYRGRWSATLLTGDESRLWSGSAISLWTHSSSAISAGRTRTPQLQL